MATAKAGGKAGKPGKLDFNKAPPKGSNVAGNSKDMMYVRGACGKPFFARSNLIGARATHSNNDGTLRISDQVLIHRDGVDFLVDRSVHGAPLHRSRPEGRAAYPILLVVPSPRSLARSFVRSTARTPSTA